MTKMTQKKLKESAYLTLQKWHSFACLGKTSRARSEAQFIIDMCKGVLKSVKRDLDPENRNKALIFGILFRGLQDFIDLSETTDLPNWIKQPNLVEKTWTYMWDCKERIEYVSNFCHHKTLDWVINEVESLEKVFLASFGPGLYSSTEILAKREICNVCKKDFRSCEHMAGGIYDGVRCAIVPQGIQLRSVSIVPAPEDPRCRIWPWQLEENRIIGTCLITTFCLDDFMDEPETKTKNTLAGMI